MISIPDWNIIPYPFPEDICVSRETSKFKRTIPIDTIRETIISILEEKGAGISREIWGWETDHRRDRIVCVMDLEPYCLYSGRPGIPSSYRPITDPLYPGRSQLIRHSLALFIKISGWAHISYLMGGRCETNGGGLLIYEYASDIKTHYFRQPDKAIRPGILLCLKNSQYLRQFLQEYQKRRISDAKAQEILIQFLEKKWIGSTQLKRALEWWKNPPSHAIEFQAKTVWRLHSAIMDACPIDQPGKQLKLLGVLQGYWYHEFGLPKD